ncbi:tRNA uracil 4-sulfurtransferase ThiI [Haloplasma contractile]|uniref:Probable tRNA sulfurtransferase n=1 Tax=Haloplasma contractile SSD-17B TaxID=1033810 RepID=U2DZL2_9MOLU|nr:tRNA uracil 4-sulfurtransferase ThiI [Haloplasma contractile]ERJ13637.1 putative tRNA sulfurtransferase protein [Haloplasma contractile SSD-17B]
MIYDRILVRYGEMTLKGKNQKLFLNRAISILKRKCKDLPKLEFYQTRNRFFIVLNGEHHNDVIERLNKVFGLYSYSLAAKCDSDINIIKALALDVMKKETNENRTFKVETKRPYKKFPLKSMEISREVGAHVLRNTENYSVDVHNPDITLKIEVRGNNTYVMTNDIMGLGGFPVGIGGKGLLMLSGGIDSPVAGYLAQKRGVEIEAIHFASPPYTSERSKQKVLDLTEKLAAYAPYNKIKVHVVPFTKLQKALYDHVPERYTMTIMRRMMYRIAEQVALKSESLIMVNGESIGQVASQTLHSMYSINHVTNMPVIRPVATMDKVEIMKIARAIDTYEISIRPYEDCCTVFVPERPETKPVVHKCEKYEASFDFKTLIEECVENTEIIEVKHGNKIHLEQNNECELNEIENLF